MKNQYKGDYKIRFKGVIARLSTAWTEGKCHTKPVLSSCITYLDVTSI